MRVLSCQKFPQGYPGGNLKKKFFLFGVCGKMRTKFEGSDRVKFKQVVAFSPIFIFCFLC